MQTINISQQQFRWGRTLLTGCLSGITIWLVHGLLYMVLSGNRGFAVWTSTGALLSLAIYAVLSQFMMITRERRIRRENAMLKLAHAIDQSASVVMITDRSGVIEYVNSRFTAMTGYTPAEVYGQTPRLLQSGQTPAVVYERLWRKILAGDEWRGEFYNRRKDGALYWELASISPLRNDAGAITHFLAVKEDITARKAAEEAEHEQRLFAEALRDTAVALNSARSLDDLLDRTLSNLEAVIPFHTADVALLKDGVTRVVRVVGATTTDEQRASLQETQLNLDDLVNLKTMARTGHAVYISDTHQHPDWINISGTEWIRSYVAAPLISGNHLSGFISLHSITPGEFNELHAERLQVFADQVALALRNFQLYAEIQEYATELEQRVAERTAQLSRRHTQLRSILDAMNDGVLYFEGGQIEYINRALRHELSRDNSFPTHPADLQVFVSPNSPLAWEQVLENARRALQRHQVWTQHLVLRHPDGSDFPALVTVSEVPAGGTGQNAATTGIVVVIHDVSQQQALQEQKDRFLSHAAHELRTPISNIKTRLYLLRNQPDRQDRHLDIMEAVTDQMESLIEDLLDIVRLARHNVSLHPETLVYQQIISAMISRQAAATAEKDVIVTSQVPDAPVLLLADRLRLGQAISRLLANAIHHTPPGGTVSLHLEVESLPAAPLPDAPVPMTRLHISDGGPGIAPEQVEQVFEPFFRATEADSQGIGLGLAIARQIILLHQGRVSVDSTPDSGTTFTIHLAGTIDQPHMAPALPTRDSLV